MNTNKLFAWLFITTGIFAIAGALYTWGDGWLFAEQSLFKKLIPLADLVVAGPISLMAGYGIGTKKRWGAIAGLVSCGIYLFGSVLVYIMIVEGLLPLELRYIIPPIFGIGISLSFIVWVYKSKRVD